MEQGHPPSRIRRLPAVVWDCVVFVSGGFVAGMFFSTAMRKDRIVDWILFSGAVIFAAAAFVKLLKAGREKN